MNIIIVGPPGAGKGTQAARLSSILHLSHIASGDLFRDIRRQDTPLAREVRGYMDRGVYVPDQLTNELVLSRLEHDDAHEGFILDGFPRTRTQAEALDGALGAENRKVNLVLYITAPPDLLLTRIHDRMICPQCHAIYNEVSKPPRLPMTCDVCCHRLEKRTDEAPDVMRTRLETYLRETQPIVQYYREKGVLTEIDGTRAMREVELEVDGALGLRGVS